VKVKETLRALGLLRSATAKLLSALWLLHLGAFGHKIDGVLACEPLYGWNGRIIR
jgi:hypothetical protein